jgi:hypothetical protein
MKKIATPHASIRYDVLKKNLLHSQEILLTYERLLKAGPGDASSVAPVTTTPVTDHIDEYHKTNPGAVVSEKLAAVVPMFRQSMTTQMESGEFLHPHGELYQHLNLKRAGLDGAASLPEKVTRGHALDLAASRLNADAGDGDKEAINNAFDKLSAEEKGDVDEGDLLGKLGKLPEYREAHGRYVDTAVKHLQQLMATRAHPDFIKNLQQMKEERERETDYANKVSEELHRQMQTHLGQGKDPQSFAGNIASLGEDPMIKHSEKAWQQKHLELGRRLWAGYREDMKLGRVGYTGDETRDGSPQTGVLPANQFWADRGFAAGVRLGSDPRKAEPSYEYLQTALKARDKQRQLYIDAYGGGGKDPKEAFDMLPVVRRYGVSSSVPQNKLEEQFLEKKANEFSNKAMKQHRANVAAHGDKLRQEKYLAQRLEELQRKPASSVGGNAEKKRQIEELQGALDKEKMKAFLWKPHDALKNFHEIQIDNDSHFDPYITDAFRYLHSAGLSHVRDEGPETYARMRQWATQNRVAEEASRAEQGSVTTEPVDLGGGAGAPVRDPAVRDPAVRAPVDVDPLLAGAAPRSSTSAFKLLYPHDAYGVKSAVPLSGVVYDPAKPEKCINDLFISPQFKSQIDNIFDEDFLKQFKDGAGIVNQTLMKKSFLNALKGAGKPTVLKILEKLGVQDSGGNPPESTFEEMTNSPAISKDTGKHTIANPDVFRDIKATTVDSVKRAVAIKAAAQAAIEGGTSLEFFRKILSQETVAGRVLKIPIDRLFAGDEEYHAALASTYKKHAALFTAKIAEADSASLPRPSREDMTKAALQSDLTDAFNEYNEDEQKNIASKVLERIAAPPTP